MNPASTTSLTSLEETDKLLTKFEIDNIPAQYREYYGIKRNNFFASIQGFPEMWQYYLRLDAVWMREFDDLKVRIDPNRLFPLILFFNAHAKMRMSIELALCGCLSEARSILRDAIEFVAHAHRLLSDPKLHIVWLSKRDGQIEEKAFKKHLNTIRRLDSSRVSMSYMQSGRNCRRPGRTQIRCPFVTAL